MLFLRSKKLFKNLLSIFNFNLLNGNIFAYVFHMKKILFFGSVAVLSAALIGCTAFSGLRKIAENTRGSQKIKNVIYFNPEVYPTVEGIQEPTYLAFSSSISNELRKDSELKILRIETPMKYDTVDIPSLKEICRNNGSDVAIVPKVKYFKVGLGKYIFSNQVVVSMKIFDAEGNMLSESSYDTFRKNKRVIGNTENSIKKGTNGALREALKLLRQKTS